MQSGSNNRCIIFIGSPDKAHPALEYRVRSGIPYRVTFKRKHIENVITYMTHLKNCNVIFKAFLNPYNAL